MKTIILAVAIMLSAGCTMTETADNPEISVLNPLFEAISREITVTCVRDDGKTCVDMR